MVFTDTTRRQQQNGGSIDDHHYYPNTTHSQRKIKQRGDLEDEFSTSFRQNEGQAAQHGVFFDDTQYDYMQHMRDLGNVQGGTVTWLESDERSSKAKNKTRLEDALASLKVGEHDDGDNASMMSRSTARSLLPSEVLPSEFVTRRSYQDQQDIPDEIAGFQPDMDARLREALEALEDEAYVEEEEDLFDELTKDGQAGEVDIYEFEDQFWGDDDSYSVNHKNYAEEGDNDDGWESDRTVKAEAKIPSAKEHFVLPLDEPNATPIADPTNGAWIAEYSKFKTGSKANPHAVPSMSEADRSMLSSLATGRKKKRKGALTNPTNYSMTSSILARTDPQALLDARFDKVMESYDNDDEEYDDEYNDTMSLASGKSAMSRASKFSKVSKANTVASGMSRVSGISTYSRATDSEAPQLVRSDFDSIMDGFLTGQVDKGGKGRRDPGQAPGRKGRRGVHGEGLRELDEIRSGLGPARFVQ